MASNDYYQSFKPNDPSHGPTTLPTSHQEPYTSYNPHVAPSQSPYNASPISPPHSPHGEFGYRPYQQNSHNTSTPYNASGALVGGGLDHDHNAYADDVPLRPHPGKQSSDNTYHNHYGEDPAIVDRVPPKKSKKSFLARIPWVVYTLTLIQVIVFIAELAKNGE